MAGWYRQRRETRLFFPTTSRRRDLARAHEVTDILLEEFVVAVKLVVFLADGLDAVENGQKRLLQCFGVPTW